MATEEKRRQYREGHEDALVASAGEPQDLSQMEGMLADLPGPSAADLDAREEHFSGPRKPMGPMEDDDVPPTEPEEA